MRTAYSHSSFSSLDIIKEISKEYNIHSLATMPIIFTSLLFNKDSKPDIGKIGEVIKGISQTPQVFMDCIVTEMNEELFFTIDYVTEYMEKEIVQSILHLGVPLPVIEKPPSAGLWKGQTDEGDMGVTYDELDRFIATGEGEGALKARVREAFSKSGHKKTMPPIAIVPLPREARAVRKKTTVNSKSR